MTVNPSTETSEPELDPFKIEGARSNRSKCKSCRHPIDKGGLRLGILIEGPFGTGYLWHHLQCAAKRQMQAVEDAYAGEFWAKDIDVPPIEDLRKLSGEAAKQKAEKKALPHVEVAPTGRAKCKRCDTPIEKGSLRVVLAREVEFYGQVRSGPINVHPGCVAEELSEENCATKAEGFAEALHTNSKDVEKQRIDAALEEIGELF